MNIEEQKEVVDAMVGEEIENMKKEKIMGVEINNGTNTNEEVYDDEDPEVELSAPDEKNRLTNAKIKNTVSSSKTSTMEHYLAWKLLTIILIGILKCAPKTKKLFKRKRVDQIFIGLANNLKCCRKKQKTF